MAVDYRWRTCQAAHCVRGRRHLGRYPPRCLARQARDQPRWTRAAVAARPMRLSQTNPTAAALNNCSMTAASGSQLQATKASPSATVARSLVRWDRPDCRVPFHRAQMCRRVREPMAHGLPALERLPARAMSRPTPHAVQSCRQLRPEMRRTLQSKVPPLPERICRVERQKIRLPTASATSDLECLRATSARRRRLCAPPPPVNRDRQDRPKDQP